MVAAQVTGAGNTGGRGPERCGPAVLVFTFSRFDCFSGFYRRRCHAGKSSQVKLGFSGLYRIAVLRWSSGRRGKRAERATGAARKRRRGGRGPSHRPNGPGRTAVSTPRRERIAPGSSPLALRRRQESGPPSTETATDGGARRVRTGLGEVAVESSGRGRPTLRCRHCRAGGRAATAPRRGQRAGGRDAGSPMPRREGPWPDRLRDARNVVDRASRLARRIPARSPWLCGRREDWTIVTIRERSRRYIQYDPAPPHLVDEPIAR
jgi:hypothetical protein